MIASATILALAYAALGRQPSAQLERETTRSAPDPWLVGLAAFVLGLPWFGLVLLAYNAFPALPAAIPLVGGLILAVIAYALITRWFRTIGWRDSSRLALITGGLMASMVAGFLIFKLGGAQMIDIVGKLILNVLAVLFLLRLARRGSFQARTK